MTGHGGRGHGGRSRHTVHFTQPIGPKRAFYEELCSIVTTISQQAVGFVCARSSSFLGAANDLLRCAPCVIPIPIRCRGLEVWYFGVCVMGILDFRPPGLHPTRVDQSSRKDTNKLARVPSWSAVASNVVVLPDPTMHRTGPP